MTDMMYLVTLLYPEKDLTFHITPFLLSDPYLSSNCETLVIVMIFYIHTPGEHEGEKNGDVLIKKVKCRGC